MAKITVIQFQRTRSTNKMCVTVEEKISLLISFALTDINPTSAKEKCQSTPRRGMNSLEARARLFLSFFLFFFDNFCCCLFSFFFSVLMANVILFLNFDVISIRYYHIPLTVLLKRLFFILFSSFTLIF